MTADDIAAEIEAIQKNPFTYLAHRLSPMELDEGLKHKPLHELVLLLFASCNYEQQQFFCALDTEITNRGLIEDRQLQHYYHNAKGLHYLGLRKSDLSIDHFTQGYQLAISLNDAVMTAKMLLNLGACFIEIGDQEKARFYTKQCLQMVPKLKDHGLISSIYAFYATQLPDAEHENGLILAKRYYDLVADKEQHLNYCWLLTDFGIFYIKTRKFQQANDYITRALSLAEKNDFFKYIHPSLRDIAELFRQQGQFDSAYNILERFITQQQQIILVREEQTLQQLNINTQQLQFSEQLELVLRHNRYLQEELTFAKKTLLEGNDQGKEQEQFHEIREAVANNEFIPFYQIKQRLSDQKTMGVELLCRWQRGSELISPMHFIEQIESHEISILFSEQLFRQGFADISPLIHAQFPSLKLSLNISPYQLANQNLAHLLSSLCVEYGIAPHNIDLEIIERTFLEHNPKALRQLFELRELGFDLSLDDFGSGYSSLACLAELPLTMVKIDRSLVKNINENEKAKQLFISIVQLIQSFRLQSVVEGIENPEQLAIAKAQLCDEAQGYLIHRPCSINDLHLRIATE